MEVRALQQPVLLQSTAQISDRRRVLLFDHLLRYTRPNVRGAAERQLGPIRTSRVDTKQHAAWSSSSGLLLYPPPPLPPTLHRRARTCPAITSPTPRKFPPPPPPSVAPQAEAPVTPDRGAGDGGRPSRLNEAPLLSGVDGLPPPAAPPTKASEKPWRVLIEGGREPEVALPPPNAPALLPAAVLPPLPPPSPPARFWFCMVW